MSDEKKLIIDDDWKQEAQREKEILAEQKKTEPARPAQGVDGHGPLPPASFQGLLSVFATQAYLALGLLRIQEDEEPVVDLEMAKYNIDLLGLIEEKTKGNLEDDEATILKEALENLRMAFVELSK